ncbi:adhesin [Sphaerisporangium melleum]|uniref:Adhesin n=1 Tax=Sphaerisporangium melleum TaxID=321316 RepID=A0A917R404_9ACTN|nr:AfsA-related hotdog domain-containing protein [Sphaerisporangium melleum]GGK87709.1 adhesin [Sphaerisporangium melleum]GII72434.1 adhesin [Sphaerisporangium melleum]
MTAPTGIEPEIAAPVLTTYRTVDRRLVHRAALAEVFLTDFATMGRDRFQGSAQLPPCHFYYGDHTTRPAIHDPLAVFESVRQMLLCATHLQHGASEETKAITAETDLEIGDPGPLRTDGGIVELSLHGAVTLEKTYQGAVSRVVHEVRIHNAAGEPIGTVRVDTALRTGEAYKALRMAYRTGPAPYSGTLPAAVPRAPVAPHLVGREQARNVVLHAPWSTAGEAGALLRVPVDHSSMFDHPQDHVPGPVMMEAARQATLLLAGECLGMAPSTLWLRSLGARYHRFTELDADVQVRARPLPGGAAGGVPRPGCGAEVTFHQGGETVATMIVGLGALPASESRDAGPGSVRDA